MRPRPELAAGHPKGQRDPGRVREYLQADRKSGRVVGSAWRF